MSDDDAERSESDEKPVPQPEESAGAEAIDNATDDAGGAEATDESDDSTGGDSVLDQKSGGGGTKHGA